MLHFLVSTKFKVFINRLATPTLIDIELSPKDRLAELGQEAQFEVFATGLCHATSFDTDLNFANLGNSKNNLETLNAYFEFTDKTKYFNRRQNFLKTSDEFRQVRGSVSRTYFQIRRSNIS